MPASCRQGPQEPERVSGELVLDSSATRASSRPRLYLQLGIEEINWPQLLLLLCLLCCHRLPCGRTRHGCACRRGGRASKRQNNPAGASLNGCHFRRRSSFGSSCCRDDYCALLPPLLLLLLLLLGSCCVC